MCLGFQNDHFRKQSPYSMLVSSMYLLTTHMSKFGAYNTVTHSVPYSINMTYVLSALSVEIIIHDANHLKSLT